MEMCQQTSCFPQCNTLKIFLDDPVQFALLFIHLEQGRFDVF